MVKSRWRSLRCLVTVILLLACYSFLGCGYHFRADGRPVGIKIESLSIPLIESTSSNIGFEADFTRIIREEFISHAKVPLVSSSKAQAVLTGRIYYEEGYDDTLSEQMLAEAGLEIMRLST